MGHLRPLASPFGKARLEKKQLSRLKLRMNACQLAPTARENAAQATRGNYLRHAAQLEKIVIEW